MTTIGTRLAASPLALGGTTFGWTSDEDSSWQVLDGFLDVGGSHIDTADYYSAFVPGHSGGESEIIIGAWMTARGNRDQLVIGTKVGMHPRFSGLSAANIAAAADASLTRLRTDYIDLYWAHRDDPDVPLQETAEAFDALVRSGKVRAIGVSNFSGARTAEWIALARKENYAVPIAVQPLYNLVRREPYERDVAPVVAAENLAVLPYQALASGFLTGKYRTEADLADVNTADSIRRYLARGFYSEAGLAVVDALVDIAREHDTSPGAVALAWLRGRPGVTAPIASARTSGQLTSMMAFTRVELTASQRSALDDISARVTSG